MKSTRKRRKDFIIDLLLQQRKELEQDIKDMYSNMFKIILAILAFVGTAFAANKWFFDGESSSLWNSPIFDFIIIEFIVVTALSITAFLINTNVNYDYIIAIDKFLEKKYGIKVLFHNGSLSRKHTTGVKGAFPLATIVLGASIILLVVAIVVYFICIDWDFYIKHLYLLLILGFQGIGLGAVLFINCVRKSNRKESPITTDVLDYFNR